MTDIHTSSPNQNDSERELISLLRNRIAQLETEKFTLLKQRDRFRGLVDEAEERSRKRRLEVREVEMKLEEERLKWHNDKKRMEEERKKIEEGWEAEREKWKTEKVLEETMELQSLNSALSLPAPSSLSFPSLPLLNMPREQDNKKGDERLVQGSVISLLFAPPSTYSNAARAHIESRESKGTSKDLNSRRKQITEKTEVAMKEVNGTNSIRNEKSSQNSEINDIDDVIIPTPSTSINYPGPRYKRARLDNGNDKIIEPSDANSNFQGNDEKDDNPDSPLRLTSTSSSVSADQLRSAYTLVLSTVTLPQPQFATTITALSRKSPDSNITSTSARSRTRTEYKTRPSTYTGTGPYSRESVRVTTTATMYSSTSTRPRRPIKRTSRIPVTIAERKAKANESGNDVDLLNLLDQEELSPLSLGSQGIQGTSEESLSRSASQVPQAEPSLQISFIQQEIPSTVPSLPLVPALVDADVAMDIDIKSADDNEKVRFKDYDGDLEHTDDWDEEQDVNMPSNANAGRNSGTNTIVGMNPSESNISSSGVLNSSSGSAPTCVSITPSVSASALTMNASSISNTILPSNMGLGSESTIRSMSTSTNEDTSPNTLPKKLRKLPLPTPKTSSMPSVAFVSTSRQELQTQPLSQYQFEPRSSEESDETKVEEKKINEKGKEMKIDENNDTNNEGPPESQAFMLAPSLVSRYLEDTPTFIIESRHLPLISSSSSTPPSPVLPSAPSETISTSISHRALTTHYGLPGTGSLWASEDRRYRFMLPSCDVNPDMPREPGKPGVLLSCRNRDIVGSGAEGDLAWTLFVQLKEQEQGVRWMYLGEYKCTEVGQINGEEFKAQSDWIKRLWGLKTTKAKRHSVYLAIRARMALRKRKKLLAIHEELELDPMAEDVDGEDESIKMREYTYHEDLGWEDVVRAFESGEETISVLKLECVGYDHEKAKDLGEIQRVFEEKEKGDSASKLLGKETAKGDWKEDAVDVHRTGDNKMDEEDEEDPNDFVFHDRKSELTGLDEQEECADHERGDADAPFDSEDGVQNENKTIGITTTSTSQWILGETQIQPDLRAPGTLGGW